MSVDLPAPFSPRRAWISPGPEIEIDAVARDDTGIPLRDSPQLERRRCHPLGSFGRGRFRHETAESFLTIPPSCLEE